MQSTGFIAVFKRELKQMFSRPLYIFGSFIVMGFCCIFFLSMLDEGLPERLPIGIVNHDDNTITRMIIREIDAGSAVEVVGKYNTYTEARESMQRGEIYAFLEIPKGTYSDLLSFKRPTVYIYVNSAYTLGGTLAYKQLATMANLATGAIQREVLRGRGKKDEQIMTLVQPVVVDTHILGNPWVNYSVYLSTTLLPGILGMMVLLLSAFSILYEIKKKTSPRWLNVAGGNAFIAVAGKMLPYTIIFTVIGWGMNVLMFKTLHFPMEGSFWFVCVATCAYIIAMQSVAVFISGCLPMPGLAISLCSMYSTLCLTLSGFSYPYEAMLPIFKALTWLVPLRHYYMITVDQMLMGLPIQASLFRFAILLAAIIFPLAITNRLKKAMINPEFIGN